MKQATFVFLWVFLLAAFNSKAQPPYGLDPTFANGGIYIGDTGGVYNVRIQPNKKIIITGVNIQNWVHKYTIKRFNEDGTIDNKFANNGVFIIDSLNLYYAVVNTACLQTDNKILLGGWTISIAGGNSNLLLARLKQNGDLDSSFGNNGTIVTGLAGDESVNSIALQSDGKIVVCGDWNGIDDQLVVLRYQANGSIDSSFGVNGMVSSGSHNWGITYPRSNGIAVMPDGRIVVGAKAKIDSLNGASAFTAIRLLPDGSLDTGFNHTGLAYSNTNLGWLLYCKAMYLQPDGKVLLAGYADSLAVMRFDTTGQLDNSFGNGGIAKIDGGFNIGNDVTAYLQPDGKIYISGQIDTANYLYRLQIDGSPDNSFGLNGKLIFYGFSIGAITTQQDAHIITAGMLKGKSAIARLKPDATNMPNMKIDNGINIFPNPASNIIYISNTSPYKILSIFLYTLEGKLVHHQYPPDIKDFNVQGLSEGLYLLKINFNNNQFITKSIFIK